MPGFAAGANDETDLVSLGREAELGPEVELDLGAPEGRHRGVVVALQDIFYTGGSPIKLVSS